MNKRYMKDWTRDKEKKELDELERVGAIKKDASGNWQLTEEGLKALSDHPSLAQH